MQKDSKIFDDFAKLASGAVGTFADIKNEVEAIIMDKIIQILYIVLKLYLSSKLAQGTLSFY